MRTYNREPPMASDLEAYLAATGYNQLPDDDALETSKDGPFVDVVEYDSSTGQPRPAIPTISGPENSDLRGPKSRLSDYSNGGRGERTRGRARKDEDLGTDDHHLGVYKVHVQDHSDASSCTDSCGSPTPKSTGGPRRLPKMWDSDSGTDDEEDMGQLDLGSQVPGQEHEVATHAHKMKGWTALAQQKFEKMLLDCIVNTDNIAPNYQDIYINRSIISQLEQVTSLALMRPNAFSCGVLKSNKVTGAVLYGPPGTGKSLLAKAVAKQSGFTMISISSSEISQKCHGDDEKVIKAVFSMARKMYPCIVFVDEADAMLGRRKAGEKRHIRAMLNQFLMEWDGLSTDTRSPFVLLATNRPSDLDTAVLRRAPVRIALNIPTKEERAGILGLLLREERLHEDISHNIIVQMTENYTGADLKNLCVMAATNCVKAQHADTTMRILTRAHFFDALNTIRPTNMSKTDANEFRKFEGTSMDLGHGGGGGHDEDEE